MPIPSLHPLNVDDFKKLNQSPASVWFASAPRGWAAAIGVAANLLRPLPSTKLGRKDLRKLWLDPSVSIETCFLSTMAWGGMRYSHGPIAWASFIKAGSALRKACEDVRAGVFKDRASEYSRFTAIKKARGAPRLGPAYFTKILFFGSPRQDAYIMDQWTVRSIHLLSGQYQTPKLTKNATTKVATDTPPQALRLRVNDRNTASDYEAFCKAVEELAGLVGISPSDAEEQMFSSGGHSPHPWRAHVMTEWRSKNFY